MRKRLVFILLVLASFVQIGSAKYKLKGPLFPYDEYISEGMHSVVDKTEPYEFIVTLTAATPYKPGVVNPDDVQWFLKFNGIRVTEKAGTLLMRLTDGTVMEIEPNMRRSYQTIYEVSNQEMKNIIEKGIIKWRIATGDAEPREENYAEDVIAKRLKPIYEAMYKAITREKSWTSNMPQTEWEARLTTTKLPKNFTYFNGVRDGLHMVGQESLGTVKLYAFSDENENIKEKNIKWLISFHCYLYDARFTIRKDAEMLLRIGNGEVFVLKNSKNEDSELICSSCSGSVAYFTALIDKEQLDKIAQYGLMRVQSYFTPRTASNDPILYYKDYKTDEIGSVIRTILPDMDELISEKKYKSVKEDF